MKQLIILIASVALLSSCVSDDDAPSESPTTSAATKSYSGEVVNDYFKLQCDIVRETPGFVPTVAARSYGYLGIAVYEAAVNGIAGSQSLQGQVQGIPAGSLPAPDPAAVYNWALATNAAASTMMRHMFDLNLSANGSQEITSISLEYQATLSAGVPADVVTRSEQYGAALADALYELSKTDGGHEAYVDPFQLPFELPTEEYCWLPTGSTTTPVTPFWKNNRSFIAGIADDTEVEAPLAYSTDPTTDFYQQAMDVYQQDLNNTDEQITIAQYWADDPFETCTPAGHSFNIVQQLLHETGATLEKSVVAYGMTAIAENDAFIACWKSKYDHMLMRPYTFIRAHIDPAYETAIATPPFPAYVSGHSVEVGASTKLLVHLFSDSSGDYNFTDLSQNQYGFAARSYANFYEMAEECAISRYYGGMHYEMDNSVGLQQGYAIGDAVLSSINWPQNIE